MDQISGTITVADTINGFDKDLGNPVLQHLNNIVTQDNEIITYYIADDRLKTQYPNLNFQLSKQQTANLYQQLINYTRHPELNYKNFVCSFNGSSHVSRRLLVAIIEKFGWYNATTVSKNFTFTVDEMDGYIEDMVGDRSSFYRKFFIGDNSESYFATTNSFGWNRYDHATNIQTLSEKLAQSFVHIVSESLSDSYYPYYGEKFLYSVVTRGLFVAWAHPRWHEYLEKHYGFKLYRRLFDYTFDQIENPVQRLVELMTMLAKFSVLTPAEWHDLYLLEQDTIEYNYDHYFSGNYMKCLERY